MPAPVRATRSAATVATAARPRWRVVGAGAGLLDETSASPWDDDDGAIVVGASAPAGSAGGDSATAGVRAEDRERARVVVTGLREGTTPGVVTAVVPSSTRWPSPVPRNTRPFDAAGVENLAPEPIGKLARS